MDDRAAGRTQGSFGVRGRGRFTVTRLHRSGADPHRLLLVGSRALLGAGRHARAEALGERIADRVWLSTFRGVDLDVLWELRPVLQAIGGGLSAWRLWRYDAVVVVYAARPVGLRAHWRSRGVGPLLRRVLRELGTASHVLVVSLDQDVDRAAARGRHADEQAHVTGGERGTGPSPRVVTMSASPDPRRAADAIARRLVAALEAADRGGAGDEPDAAHRRRLHPDDEAGRQRAVDGLGLRGRQVGRRLQQVVELAQATFETGSAEITVIDRDRQWTMAASGWKRDDQPREASLCNRAIERPAPTLIADTWQVPTLRGDPQVTGGRPIRFYAAHPIESVDGYRIGVLCVWDTVPHPIGELDASVLRDLALLAEAEIIIGGRAG